MIAWFWCTKDIAKAEICPIYKKGNNLDVSNYRPVSILPGISKVFERVMVNQLSNYFNDIFSPLLSGFRKQHSCETVLYLASENNIAVKRFFWLQKTTSGFRKQHSCETVLYLASENNIAVKRFFCV